MVNRWLSFGNFSRQFSRQFSLGLSPRPLRNPQPGSWFQ